MVQWDIVWESPERNRNTIDSLLANDDICPGDLVVLPETCLTGFTHNRDFAADNNQADRAYFAGVAARLGVTLVSGTIEDSQNVALVHGPAGDLLARYVKQQPFRHGGEVWRAGDEPVVFDWNGIRVSPFICYDLRFPELFRAAAARWQPELMLVIASWPVARIHHWTRLLTARAIENQCFVAGVNRTGSDPGYSFPGSSVCIDWNGDVLADSGSEIGITTASLNADGLNAYRTALPFLQSLTN
jgi:predicted amidohydrolase